jgi:hypothetical protein
MQRITQEMTGALTPAETANLEAREAKLNADEARTRGPTVSSRRKGARTCRPRRTATAPGSTERSTTRASARTEAGGRRAPADIVYRSRS